MSSSSNSRRSSSTTTRHLKQRRLDNFFPKETVKGVERKNYLKPKRLTQVRIESMPGVVILKHLREDKATLEDLTTSEEKIVECLNRLQQKLPSIEFLRQTGIGITVNRLRKRHVNKEVKRLAKRVARRWEASTKREGSMDEKPRGLTGCRAKAVAIISVGLGTGAGTVTDRRTAGGIGSGKGPAGRMAIRILGASDTTVVSTASTNMGATDTNLDATKNCYLDATNSSLGAIDTIIGATGTKTNQGAANTNLGATNNESYVHQFGCGENGDESVWSTANTYLSVPNTDMGATNTNLGASPTGATNDHLPSAIERTAFSFASGSTTTYRRIVRKLALALTSNAQLRNNLLSGSLNVTDFIKEYI